MAVAFEGFSIREYVAKVRSVDVLKCCPFAAADSKERAESLLPPITVTKFKWWSHELHRLRSTQEITLLNKESSDIPRNDIQFAVAPPPQKVAAPPELLCPVCKEFSAATVNAVNAHIDGCLAHASRREDRRKQMSRKAKSKPLKKRSIAEIFAVAPQIQAALHVSEEEEEEEDGDDHHQLVCSSVSRLKAKKVKKRKIKEKKRVLEENGMAVVANKLKMKMKKNNKKRKENSCKLKLQTPVNFAKKLNKRFAMDILDAATVCARTPNLKYLSTQKQKVVQTSKLIPKHKKPMFPIRSILKNQAVCGQNSTFCGMQGDSQANPCGTQHSKRHVRFSGKDDILGPRKNRCSSFEHNTSGNLFSDTFTSSSEKDQSTDSNKEAAPVEVDRRENDVSVGTDNGNEASNIIGRKQLPNIPDHVDIPSFLRPHITHQEHVNHLPEKSVPSSRVAIQDNNLHMFDQGYPTTSHKPAYAGIPRMISVLEEPCVNTQEVTVSRAFDSSGKMIDHVVHPIHGVSVMTSKENTRAFPEPSSSNFTFSENTNGRFPFLSQSEIDNISDRGLHCQSLCPPMDLMSDSYSFPEWKQRAVTFKERHLAEEFFGLPLNSQGELIQLSSSDRSGFNQLRNLNTITGSSSSLPAQNFTQLTGRGDYLTAYNKHFVEREVPNDQLNLFPMQNYVKEHPSLHLPDRLGATYLERTQRVDIHQPYFESRSSHSFRPLDSDLNLINISFNGCRQFDQVQNQTIGGMIPKENSGHMSPNTNQQTMRLMGKDVAIGKSSRELQGFEDEVWMDKEIITEHCPSSTALHNSSLNRNFQQNWFPHTAAGKLKETVAQSFEIHSEQAPLRSLLMKAPESTFPHPYYNWQSNSVFQNGNLTDNRSPSSHLLHFAQLPTSPAMYNGVPSFQEPFISGAESLQSLQFGSQLPVLSTPQNTCGHGVLIRPAEFSYKQNPPHFTKSTFTFPFLNPECRENVRPPWFESSSKGLPPWLLHATLQGKPPITASLAFPNLGSKHHQHIMPRSNVFNAPSMQHSSEISYPYNSVASHSQVKSSPSLATTLLPPLGPVIPGVRPTSAIMGYRNRIKVKDRLKSKAFGIKDPYPCKKTKKRLGVKAVDSTKPPNILNLELQEKMSAVAGSSTRNFISDMQSNLRELNLDSSGKKASGLGCSLNETQKDGFGAFGIESSKVDGIVRPGPIKLCAGAKHILKPTQNVDQDNSRPIHSTIPFVAVTNGCREPEPKKKSTKIYRF